MGADVAFGSGNCGDLHFHHDSPVIHVDLPLLMQLREYRFR